MRGKELCSCGTNDAEHKPPWQCGGVQSGCHYLFCYITRLYGLHFRPKEAKVAIEFLSPRRWSASYRNNTKSRIQIPTSSAVARSSSSNTDRKGLECDQHHMVWKFVSLLIAQQEYKIISLYSSPNSKGISSPLNSITRRLDVSPTIWYIAWSTKF